MQQRARPSAWLACAFALYDTPTQSPTLTAWSEGAHNILLLLHALFRSNVSLHPPISWHLEQSTRFDGHGIDGHSIDGWCSQSKHILTSALDWQSSSSSLCASLLRASFVLGRISRENLCVLFCVSVQSAAPLPAVSLMALRVVRARAFASFRIWWDGSAKVCEEQAGSSDLPCTVCVWMTHAPLATRWMHCLAVATYSSSTVIQLQGKG